jgi:SAM-dependent methyltransferase
MGVQNSNQQKEILDQQRRHWEKALTDLPEMFGAGPSDAARKAAELYRKEEKRKILELGGGQGRDALFFAENGFHVTVLDYCESGIVAIADKASQAGLAHSIIARCQDIRDPLPFGDESFDACYSHMLYCMAFTTQELESISKEIHRILRPGGLNVYTVRHTEDPHFGKGVRRGEDMYEVNGFIVHFFSVEKIRHLAEGYEMVDIDKFEEGTLPRKLFRVTLRKK